MARTLEPGLQPWPGSISYARTHQSLKLRLSAINRANISLMSTLCCLWCASYVEIGQWSAVGCT